MIRLSIRAPSDAAEQVLASVLELAPGGVEQVDGPGWVEFAIYGTPGELPLLPSGEADIGGVRVRVGAREVPDDWEERWRRFHHPLLLDGRLYVRPPWDEAALRPGVTEIVIDPGQAFGTGTHATTRMCLELLLELKPGGSFADLGCGSGVLAITASKLGWAPVAAFDADPLAVEATGKNARVNAVLLDRVERFDLRDEAPPHAVTVTANLMRPLLLRVAELITEPPKQLILSGLLDEEANEVAAAFAPLAERARLSRQGWTAVLLTN